MTKHYLHDCRNGSGNHLIDVTTKHGPIFLLLLYHHHHHYCRRRRCQHGQLIDKISEPYVI